MGRTGYAYFRDISERERKLERHGFDHEPTEEEAFDYCMLVDDKVTTLARAMGLAIAPDVRGKLHVCYIGSEEVETW